MSDFKVLGESGITRPCLVALDMVLSGPLDPQRATVLTKNGNEHLFVLWGCGGWPFEGIIIPTGFMSGYGGEGGRGFSLALCMLYEHDIPIDHVEVTDRKFDSINAGHFPAQWQERVRRAVVPCEMPIPGWVFVPHWNLLKRRRLWRVQHWRSIDIELAEEVEDVDDFSRIVGDKLWSAATGLRRNAPPQRYQHAGLTLRDAWIEFSNEQRRRIGPIPEQPGKNDVKATLRAMKLEEGLLRRAEMAVNSTNHLLHDRNAGWDKAEACFNATVAAMSEMVGRRSPIRVSPVHDDEWISAN